VGHSGAIYGFSTALEMLPDDKLGVAVVITLDCTNAVANHIADHALRALLAARQGGTLPDLPTITAVPAATADALAGRYRSDDQVVDVVYRGGRLMLFDGEMRAELRATRDVLVIDDRLRWGPLVEIVDGGLELGGKSYRRAAAFEPVAAPARFKGLIGEYGWDYDTLYILEHDGVLHALIEWFYEYPLREIGDGVFQFPDHGLYAGEKVVFTRDARGEATQVVAASVRFPRRRVGTADGETFRIQPLLSMEELRRAAAAASPPAESGKRDPELVELASLSPTIKLDIRYATTNNFMSAQFYSQARAFLQRPAADALLRAHESLRPLGYGLLIHDAYRPWAVTKMFFDATPADKKIFVADPAKGSRHNRGCAVDLSLYDLKTGAPVQMVGGYDEMSERSYPDYPGGTSRQRWLRDTLRDAMEAQGFTVYEFEWWHFDYRDWREYPILNVSFEQIR
jgi:D-alanyl-D-alanine dipeptidase